MNHAASLYRDLGRQAYYPPLKGACRADVAIVGAGITGLSTALHLARQGVSVVVLEARQPGWGASGRNGGQVNPGLKPAPSDVIKAFGRDHGERLVTEAWNSPELVYELIDRYQIACNLKKGGTIRAATFRRQLDSLYSLLTESLNRSWPAAWLNQGEMAERTGTHHYPGGMIDHRGGQLDPLAYTKGLAGAVVAEGASVLGMSTVTAITRQGGGWLVDTAAGRVQAGTVILTTNGYTDDLLEPLRRSIIPVFSAIVASDPMRPALRERILNRYEVLYELGRITTYYRVDPAGRMIFGGRSHSAEAMSTGCFPALINRVAQIWPELQSLNWTHGWNGQLAMTVDHYPHWHNPAPDLYAMLGYNGRGVAMATVSGRAMAQHLTKAEAPLFPFSPIRSIRGHVFWKLGVAGHITLGRVRDALDQMR